MQSERFLKTIMDVLLFFLTRVIRVTIMIDMIYNTLILKQSSNEELISRKSVFLSFCWSSELSENLYEEQF